MALHRLHGGVPACSVFLTTYIPPSTIVCKFKVVRHAIINHVEQGSRESNLICSDACMDGQSSVALTDFNIAAVHYCPVRLPNCPASPAHAAAASRRYLEVEAVPRAATHSSGQPLCCPTKPEDACLHAPADELLAVLRFLSLPRS